MSKYPLYQKLGLGILGLYLLLANGCSSPMNRTPLPSRIPAPPKPTETRDIYDTQSQEIDFEGFRYRLITRKHSTKDGKNTYLVIIEDSECGCIYGGWELLDVDNDGPDRGMKLNLRIVDDYVYAELRSPDDEIIGEIEIPDKHNDSNLSNA